MNNISQFVSRPVIFIRLLWQLYSISGFSDIEIFISKFPVSKKKSISHFIYASQVAIKFTTSDSTRRKCNIHKRSLDEIRTIQAIHSIYERNFLLPSQKKSAKQKIHRWRLKVEEFTTILSCRNLCMESNSKKDIGMTLWEWKKKTTNKNAHIFIDQFMLGKWRLKI